MARRSGILALAVLLLTAMLAGSASGEALFDFSDRDYLLPIDFSAGLPPKKEKMNGIVSYEDSTISVTVEQGVSGTAGYWVADIQLTDISQLRTMAATMDGAFSRAGKMTAMNLTERSNAVLAINGDLFNSSERKGFGYAIRQGRLYRDNLDTPGRWNSKLMDLLLIDEDGDFHVIYRAEAGQAASTINGKRIVNAFSFGPVLVDNGSVVTDFQGADKWFDMAAGTARARSCICQVGPLHYKVICCTGNYHMYSGMTLKEFAALVALQDVQVAYNLDGGDSVWLYLNGERVNVLGSKSERKLMDIIYFATAEP